MKLSPQWRDNSAHGLLCFSGLTVDNLMKFCVNALQHHSGQVRTLTENLIIKLYKQHGSVVKNYLPPDDDKTRKSTLYRQLFEAFDVIDGKPSRKDLEVSFTLLQQSCVVNGHVCSGSIC